MYSAFTCPGHGWPVNNTNLVSRGHEFQHWLMAVQSDCARLSLYTEDAPHNGITSSINYAIKHFVTAHELGAIYRPRGVHPQWEWAHSDPAKCTLGIKGVDCFFQPLSLCGYESAVGAELYTKVSVEEIDAVYLKWTKAKRDVCGTARAFKVAVQWVFAQYMTYLFRMPISYNVKRSEVLRNTTVSEKLRHTSSTMGVHIRGGNRNTSSMTYIDGRLPLSIDHYVKHIDEFAIKLKNRGKPLALVYLSSDRASETFISEEHMNTNFPRPYKFVTVPHIDLGPDEPEANALKPHKKHLFMREQLTSEVINDIEKLVNVDVFLGSSSNFYPVITSLRIGRNIGNYNDSCMVILTNGAKNYGNYICEGTKEMRDNWRLYFGGLEEENRSSFVDYTD